MDIINERHKLSVKQKVVHGEVYYAPIPYLVCKDGFTMSVQASANHYCSPRETAAWPYGAFEVGFPSAREEALMQYAEDPETPTKTVYGWVPRDTIIEIIEKHGGLEDGPVRQDG